jgi:membrane fusion protein (multidrug efflux system)
MIKRMLVMLGVVAAVVLALGYVKYTQIQAAIAQSTSFRPPPEAVTTIVAREETWESTVAAIGSVTAVQGVLVSADLPGIVETINFSSGQSVGAGTLLVALDTRQERAQLQAAEAERDLARTDLERLRGLRAKGVVAQAELDRAEAEHKRAEARVGEIVATVDRKRIHAPFAGVLGIRQVHLGQYLNPGDPVVPLQSLQPIHVDFALPQQDVGLLRPGTEVRVTVAGDPSSATTGQVTAVDSVVDQATRNLLAQVTLPNGDRRLRPGMFVEVSLVASAGREVVVLPASAISYAPYGDSVFIVEQVPAPDGASYTGVRQQFVTLGGSRGDQVAVLAGVAPGEEVVTSGLFKLRPGAAVEVHNEVLPGNDPAPAPENS